MSERGGVRLSAAAGSIRDHPSRRWWGSRADEGDWARAAPVWLSASSRDAETRGLVVNHKELFRLDRERSLPFVAFAGASG